MKLETMIERGQQIRDAMPALNAKQRLGTAAAELAVAGSNQTRVELLNEAVLRFTTLIYTTDNDGVLRHVDRRNYRVMAAAPWGSSGWKCYDVRAWESRILRQVLMARLHGRVAPLFDYGCQQWYLNFSDYPRLDIALLYWKKHPVTLAEWRPFADAERQKSANRAARNRK